jgi:hypothetical protein
VPCPVVWQDISCVRRGAFIRGQQFSMLPALTVDGIIALDILEGSVNKDKFIEYNDKELVSNPVLDKI